MYEGGLGHQLAGEHRQQVIDFGLDSTEARVGRQDRHERHRHSSIGQREDHAAVYHLVRMHQPAIDTDAHDASTVLRLIDMQAEQLKIAGFTNKIPIIIYRLMLF